ncbi:MAG: hypothetical protein KF716_03735 [Anaerolineae bacterium]|nr:hypothetical protein [Anaerolineae bacterium]
MSPSTAKPEPRTNHEKCEMFPLAGEHGIICGITLTISPSTQRRSMQFVGATSLTFDKTSPADLRDTLVSMLPLSR